MGVSLSSCASRCVDVVRGTDPEIELGGPTGLQMTHAAAVEMQRARAIRAAELIENLSQKCIDDETSIREMGQLIAQRRLDLARPGVSENQKQVCLREAKRLLSKIQLLEAKVTTNRALIMRSEAALGTLSVSHEIDTAKELVGVLGEMAAAIDHQAAAKEIDDLSDVGTNALDNLDDIEKLNERLSDAIEGLPGGSADTFALGDKVFNIGSEQDLLRVMDAFVDTSNASAAARLEERLSMTPPAASSSSSRTTTTTLPSFPEAPRTSLLINRPAARGTGIPAAHSTSSSSTPTSKHNRSSQLKSSSTNNGGAPRDPFASTTMW